MNKSILIISDTHIPYHHKDVIAFLKGIKKKYKPDRIIHIGDEIDSHAISFHDSDPDLYRMRKTISDNGSYGFKPRIISLS